MNTRFAKRCVTLAAALPALASLCMLNGCVVEARPRPVVYEPAPRPVYVEQSPPPTVYVQQQPPPPQPVVVDPPPGEVVVVDQPPPEPVEVRPPQPGPDVVWAPGFYVRVGGGWQWQPGSWQHPPCPGVHYEPDRWVPARGGGYVRVQGGWR